MLYIQLVYIFLLQFYFHSVLTTDSDSRIFGGVKLQTQISNYLVALKIKLNLNGEEVKKTCTGSILNNHWIISAAHCFRSKINENVTVERFEEDKFETITHVSPSEIRFHPKYRKDESINAAQHDIALLKTDELRNVQSIKLSDGIPKIGQIATIAGYGETESTPKPKQGKVIIQRKRKMICSIGKTWGGHGDSGGPLISGNHLVGIISRRKCNGVQCVTYYADIHSNVKWIESVLNN
ncbi:trypsin 3A1-like [Choristoneura fumiferana]|uniref:trypsin 3A1-like n=1 Tax=Choristoneura fumiferana TaxID=7141 RepID=UPI003D158090